jgi:hypothetical protein
MVNIKNELSGLIFSIFLIVLAVWLSPFILIVVFIFVGYKIQKVYRLKLLLRRISNEWISQGKYCFFLYSNSAKWKDYFEKNLIPQIDSISHVRNWSYRHNEGWVKNSIEKSILDLIPRKEHYYYPIAIIFYPDREPKIFEFYSSYVEMIKNDDKKYKKIEKEFIDAINEIKSLSTASKNYI